ncbi:hypothetical protein PCANC_07069 [Puccinia coronata f. sp. avenae]|uniref:Uncharacterized protein n=1 Tax=Puccinia coronata f. sp. avenae TaxID=200324 RepID=A0A2N5VZJ7_9BASI|nr:hypothetical protein PCASD_20862 [Puccinia coronata f. sp. avenae]PLW55428.1 hypothetical protein PCANC_07069 [Puccinia coronata f. sp. avenae]
MKFEGLCQPNTYPPRSGHPAPITYQLTSPAILAAWLGSQPSLPILLPATTFALAVPNSLLVSFFAVRSQHRSALLFCFGRLCLPPKHIIAFKWHLPLLSPTSTHTIRRRFTHHAILCLPWSSALLTAQPPPHPISLLLLSLIFPAVPRLHISYTKSPSCANSKPIQSYIFLIHSAHTLMLLSQTALAASKIVLKSQQAPSECF